MIQNSKEYETWFIRVGRFRMERCRLLSPGIQLDWDMGVAGEENFCLRSKLCHLQILYVYVSGNRVLLSICSNGKHCEGFPK